MRARSSGILQRGARGARAWCVWLLALMLCAWPGASRADDGNVRSGVTVVTPPAAPSGTSAPKFHGAADAPRGTVALSIRPPPASFMVRDEGWIRYAYEPSEGERVAPLMASAPGVRTELALRLGQPVLGKVTVYIARSAAEMKGLAPEGAPYPDYASGVAYPGLGLVLLTIQPLTPNSVHDLGEVFRHELAHVALHDAVGAHDVPRWFDEGFAVNASGESRFNRLQALWTATLADQLVPLRDLDARFPSRDTEVTVAYAQSADVVRFLTRAEDAERFTQLIARVRAGSSFDASLQDAYSTTTETLEHEWREDVARRYSFWPFFFGGSFVWMGAIVLFFFGWRRKRRQQAATLARWGKEEAAEDLRRARELMLQRQREQQQPRMHIVLSRSERPPLPNLPPPLPDHEVPKVRHDGDWHTLH
jgi:hypothetical protein